MIKDVSLGIPCWRADIKREFLGSMLANLIRSPGLIKDAYIAANVNIAAARNQIVDNTVMSAIFMTDPDTVLPQKAVETLAKHDLPIVTGLYFKRTPPFTPNIYKKSADKTIWEPIVDYPESGLLEVEACGAGCLLVKREVFQKIGYPYFEYVEGIRSEDMDFCEKAAKAGYKIFCDVTVKCGHATETIVNEISFRLAYADYLKKKEMPAVGPKQWQIRPSI